MKKYAIPLIFSLTFAFPIYADTLHDQLASTTAQLVALRIEQSNLLKIYPAYFPKRLSLFRARQKALQDQINILNMKEQALDQVILISISKARTTRLSTPLILAK